MSRSKTKSQLEAELRVLRRARFSEGTVAVLLSFIRWGAIILIARYGYLSVDALAGKTTLTDIFIRFLSGANVSITVAWSFGICGLIYGWRQRKLRRDTIERIQNRTQNLEKIIDPGRTSSKLTSRGDTRPEDKI